MVIYNGAPQREDIWGNRAFLLGDGVFETLKVVLGRVLFVEDHYFRLMASMRILRMEIPMAFTLEYFESQAVLAATENGLDDLARVRFTVFRAGAGKYTPQTRDVNWHIAAEPLAHPTYQVNAETCEVDLYKDFHISAQLLSTLKTTNRLVNITAAIYAQENGLQNCLLINDAKNIVEAVNGNIFLLIDGSLVTPPLADGCLNGIMRRQIIAVAKKTGIIDVVERPVSPFELQKADEMWITNVITGITAVSRYRKKDFDRGLAVQMCELVNRHAQIS